MDEIRLDPAGVELLRDHLGRQCQNPKTAAEITKALEVLEVPVSDFLCFVAGGDIEPERIQEMSEAFKDPDSE